MCTACERLKKVKDATEKKKKKHDQWDLRKHNLCSVSAAQVHRVSTHKHSHLSSYTQTPFPLLDIPEGEPVPQETVAINEVGMVVEWEGMRKKGSGANRRH